MALWLLVKLILTLPTLALLLTSAKHSLAGYVAVSGSFLLVGLLAAWLINKAASSTLSRVQKNSETDKAPLSENDQRLLFQLVGLYFAVSALVQLPDALAFLPHVAEMSWRQLPRPAGLVFQLGMGLWLIGQAAFWVGLFQKLRGRS
jgi:hypothetical protein